MEDVEQKTLVNELSQGKELAKQLMNHLQQSSSQETRDFLVGKILSSYEKALSMLNHVNHKESKTSTLESPHHSLGNTSPRSVFFDQDTAPGEVFKKRKTMAKWTEKVKVCLATGIEGPLEDGYSWRKYGQKDILGSNHPRGYFRCTHRNSQGCLATKLVQRSDEDSSLFEVTYRGAHTCSRSSQPSKQGHNEQKVNYPHLEQKERNLIESHSTNLLNLKAGLEVKTEDLDTMVGNIFPPFSFPPNPIESDEMDNPFLSESIIERMFEAGFSPAFMSPAVSEAGQSLWDVMAFGLGSYNNVQTSESDLSEIFSAHTSVNNSPICDFAFTIDNVDFDSEFSFESPEFSLDPTQ